MTRSLPFVIILASTTLTGCMSTTPQYDARFGDAVASARALQTINPDASGNSDPVAGIDGRAAKHTIDRYNESFKSPPPTFSIISIGGGVGGSE